MLIEVINRIIPDFHTNTVIGNTKTPQNHCKVTPRGIIPRVGLQRPYAAHISGTFLISRERLLLERGVSLFPYLMLMHTHYFGILSHSRLGLVKHNLQVFLQYLFFN